MIGVESLITKINTLIGSGSLTESQILQLSGAINALENYGVSKVATPTDLPNPVTNKGRFIFIESDNRYVISDGIVWDISRILDTSGIRLYAWGYNTNGQIGDNTTVSKSSPVSVVGGITDWIQLSNGQRHTVGIRANGTAWSWGQGTLGRLGDGASVAKSSPVPIVGGFADWIQVSAGEQHTVGIRANGTAWAWGVNTSGRLGDGTTTVRSSPVAVVGGFVDWIQVSGGLAHSLGLRANGTAWAWGSGVDGVLGDGTISVSKSSPVAVVGGFADWIQLSASTGPTLSHSIGLRANGTLWSWGSNSLGRLGDGTTATKSSPVAVVGGFVDWIQVNAGGGHNIALRANGTLWAWGTNVVGQLGDGSLTTASKSSPVAVVGGFTDWVQLSVNGQYNIGIRANGTAWSWGGNFSGNLGDGTIVNKSSPVSVIGGFTDWVQVAAGGTGAGLRG